MIVEFGYVEENKILRFYYTIKARNGQPMVVSRTYSTYLKCVDGWRTFQKSLRISDSRVKYKWTKEMVDL